MVMREKYFSDSNFLKANLGKRPSFAWRSIWQAKSLLEEGIIWRVGNGSKIKIWEDKWIPSTFSHRIQDPVRVLNREAKVADIINLDTNGWNIPLIEHIFPSGTVEKICSLAISPRTQEDKLVWAGSKSGAFSVRSAYHLEVDRRSRVVGSSSVCASSNSSWSRIWKMKIPRSIILFLWRASNEIHPTKSNLFKRKLIPDPLCPMCGIEAETSGHALWSCEAARAVWGSCGGSIQKSSIVASDFLVIFGYLCDRLDEGELELFAVTAHKIWLRRNSLVFGGPVQSPSCLLKGATEELADFRNSVLVSIHQSNNGYLPPAQWTRPAKGNVKINWDAALDGQNRLMGVGIIARDSNGRVVAAMCSFLPYIKDPSVAEAIGAKRAVEFGKERGFSSIELEGDALEIVLALSSLE
jgi:hypothetical protein